MRFASPNSSVNTGDVELSFGPAARWCTMHRQCEINLIDYDAEPPQNYCICMLCQVRREGHRVVPQKEFHDRMEEYRVRRSKQVESIYEFCKGLKRQRDRQMTAINRLQADIHKRLATLRKAATDRFIETSEYCDRQSSHFSNECLQSILSGNSSFEDMEALIQRELQSWEFLDRVETTIPVKLRQCLQDFQGITGQLQELNTSFNGRLSKLMALYEKSRLMDLTLTEMEEIIHEERKVVKIIAGPTFWNNCHKHEDVTVDGPKASRRRVEVFCHNNPVIVSVLGDQVLDHKALCVYKWKIRLCTIKSFSGFGMCIEKEVRKQRYMSHSSETKGIRHGHYLIYAETKYISSHCNRLINNTSRGEYFPKTGVIEISYDTYASELIFVSEETGKTFKLIVERPKDRETCFRPEIRLYDEGDEVEFLQ